MDSLGTWSHNSCPTRKRERPASQKGKGKSRTLFELSSHLATRPHARTRTRTHSMTRNDFPADLILPTSDSSNNVYTEGVLADSRYDVEASGSILGLAWHWDRPTLADRLQRWRGSPSPLSREMPGCHVFDGQTQQLHFQMPWVDKFFVSSNEFKCIWMLFISGSEWVYMSLLMNYERVCYEFQMSSYWILVGTDESVVTFLVSS